MVAGLIIYFAMRDNGNGNPNSANALDGLNGGVCTMDAMECPDGSFVGRVPPSCEFAACPGSTSTAPLIDPNDEPSKG